MRRFLPVLILVAGFLLVAGTALSLEAVVGKVVTIDRGNKRLVLQPLAAGAEPLEIRFETSRMPPGLRTGDLVRVKGDFVSQGPNVLRSRMIWCGCAGRRGWDKTGVRSRLYGGYGGYGRRHGGGGAHGR